MIKSKTMPSLARQSSQVARANEPLSKPLYGWVEVCTRSLLHFLAVILFLRLGWITLEAGVGLALAIVIGAFAIALTTGITVAALSAEIDGNGGFYETICLFSNSAFGGALSVLYAIANALSATVFVMGFAEVTVFTLSYYGGMSLAAHAHNVMRLTGVLATTFVFVLSLFEHRHASRLRLFVLIVIIVCSHLYIIDLLVTTKEDLLPTTGHYRSTLLPHFSGLHTLFTIFAIFFPAANCVMIGANINGQLRRPQTSILKGTLVAVAAAVALYVVSTVSEEFDQSGRPVPTNLTLIEEEITSEDEIFNRLRDIPFPIIICLFVSTIAGAVQSLRAGGVVLKDIGLDNVLPYVDNLSVGYGKANTPRRAFAAVAVMTAMFSLIGDFNLVAVITSVFYLCIYCLVNYCGFRATISGASGLKPSAPLFNRFVALTCSFVSFFLMLGVSWLLAVPALFIFGIIYIYIKFSQNAETSRVSHISTNYMNTLHGLSQMQHSSESDKHYRPQILVLTGNPAARPALVDFAFNISKGLSLLVCGNVIPLAPSLSAYQTMERADKKMAEWLRKREINAFGASVPCVNQMHGAVILLQTVGLGKLRPNILMIGYKTNWMRRAKQDISIITEFYDVILNAFEKNVAVTIFRNSANGFDLSELMRTRKDSVGDEELDEPEIEATSEARPMPRKMTKVQQIRQGVQSIIRNKHKPPDVELGDDKTTNTRFQVHKYSASRTEQQDLVAQMYRFRTRITNGTIDVWWLKDDGGLTLLLPHLLSMPKSYLEGARIRVFTKTKSNSKKVEDDQKAMVNLMRKLHIPATDLHLMTEFEDPIKDDTKYDFENIIAPFMEGAAEPNSKLGIIKRSEIEANVCETAEIMKLSELLQEHSAGSDLIVITLPQPKRQTTSAAMYLAWLEVMSRDLPPVLFVRGNRANVATFYS